VQRGKEDEKRRRGEMERKRIMNIKFRM